MSWDQDDNGFFDPDSSLLDFSVRDWGDAEMATPSPTRAVKKQLSGQKSRQHQPGSLGVVEEDTLSDAGEPQHRPPPPPPPPPADGFTPSTRTATSIGSTRNLGGSSSVPDNTRPNFASPSSTYSNRKRSEPGYRSPPGKSNSYGSPGSDHKRLMSPQMRKSKSSRSGFASDNHDTAETAPSTTLDDEDGNDMAFSSDPFPSDFDSRPSTPPNVSDSLNAMSGSNTNGDKGDSYSFEIDLPPPADVSPLSSKDSVVALMVQRAVEEAMAKNQMGGPPLMPPAPRVAPGSGRSRKSRLNDRDRMQRAARGVMDEQKKRLGPLHEEEGFMYTGSLNDEEGSGSNYRRAPRRHSGGGRSQYSSNDSHSIHPEDIEQSHGARSQRRKAMGNSFSSGTGSSQEDSYNRGDDRSRRGDRRRSQPQNAILSPRREQRSQRDRRDDDRNRYSSNSDVSSSRRVRRGRKPGNESRRRDDDGRRDDDRSRRHRSRSRGAPPDRDEDSKRRRHRSRSRHYSPEGRDRDRGARSSRNLARGGRNRYDDESDEQSGRRRGRRDRDSDYDYDDGDRKSRRRRSRSPDDRYYDDDRRSRDSSERDEDDYYRDDDRRRRRRPSPRRRDEEDDDRKNRRGRDRRGRDDYYEDERRRRHRSKSRHAERDYDNEEDDDRRRRRRSRSRGRDRSYDRHEDNRRRHRSKSRGRGRGYDDDEDRRRSRGGRSKSRPRGSYQDNDERSHVSAKSTKSTKSRESRHRQDLKSPTKSMRAVLKEVPSKALTRSSKREQEKDVMELFHESMSEVLTDFKINGPRQSDHEQNNDSGSNAGNSSKASKWDKLRAARAASNSGDENRSGSKSPRPGNRASGGSPSKWSALRKSADFIVATKTKADRSRRRRTNRSPTRGGTDRQEGGSAEPGTGATKQGRAPLNEKPAGLVEENEEVQAAVTPPKWDLLRKKAQESSTQNSPPSPSKWAALRAGNNFVRQTKMRVNEKRSQGSLGDDVAQEDIHFSPTQDEDQPRSPMRFVEPKLTPLVMDGEKVTTAPQAPNIDKEPIEGETATVANNSISTGALTDTAAVGMADGSRWTGLNRAIKETVTSQEPVISEKTDTTSDVEFVPDGFRETKPDPDKDGLVQVQPKITPVVLNQGEKKDAVGSPPSNKWGALRGSMEILKSPVKQGSGGRRLGLMQQDKPGSGRRLGLMQQDKQGSGRRLGLMKQEKSGSGRKVNEQDNGAMSKWTKLKHSFTFITEAKKKADDRRLNEDELEYGAVNSGNDFFEVTDADRKEYEDGIREQAMQADVNSENFVSDPPQLDFVEGAIEGKAESGKGKKSWQNFSQLIKENRQKASESRERRSVLQTEEADGKRPGEGSPDVDGCVKVPPKIAPVLLKSKLQQDNAPFPEQTQLDGDGFFGTTPNASGGDGGSNKADNNKPSQKDDGLVQIKPKMAPVVLKTSAKEAPAAQTKVPEKKANDGLVQITPKLTPVVLKSQQDAAFFPPMDTDGGPKTSKWAGLKASNAFINSTKKKANQIPPTDPFSAPAGDSVPPELSKWAGVKASNDFINSTKRKTRRRRQKESETIASDRQAEENENVGGEIKFVPPGSSQWDGVRKANELIQQKRKRLADIRARQKDPEGTGDSVQSRSVVSSDQGDSASDVTGDIKFNPTQGDPALASIEELKASRLQKLKMAAATFQEANEKSDKEQDKALRRQQRRSKWNGLRTGVEFVNRTKKLADESKTREKTDSALAETDTSAAKKKTSDSKWSDLKAQMAAARETDGMEEDENGGAVKASRWAEIQAKLETDEKNTPEPAVSSRWGGLRKHMVANTGAEGVTGTSSGTGTKSKRSLWDGLKQDSKRVLKIERTDSGTSDDSTKGDRATRREERKARRANRWNAVKTGMDFIGRTKKLSEDRRKTTKQK